MEWTADVSSGQWLRDRLDTPWRGTIHDAVPRGYPAYARIFHPATRDRPIGRPWPPLPYGAHRREWDAFQHADVEIDVERVGWARTAAAIGTAFHPLAQWQALVAPALVVEHEDGPRDGDGWRYGEPVQGELDADLLARVSGLLVAHTGTPDRGAVALWEGWGDLVGHLGVTPSRAFLQMASDGDSARDDAHEALLARSIRDPLNDAFRKPTWQPGILSDDISRGPRLSLPERDYVLFHGDLAEFTAPEWPLHVPWRDRAAEEHGFPPSAHSPSLIWPADRAWVLVSEVDWDSTIVAGSADLVDALCATDGIEALPVPADASLLWDADAVNR